jgi:hypothetical protein
MHVHWTAAAALGARTLMNFPDLLFENSVWHFRRDRGHEPFLQAFLIAESKVAIARSAEQDRCTAVATGGHELSSFLKFLL